ncbi:hypothetical protein Airi02_039170 [Actinoallomurus iriomotensis]|uniref:DUF7669 domain-containing protein n=2 Tax=Actinoallomurus iriomotensis TaxID=478107 RepID=A0A9W6VUU4_9ACTN|nr:hypothetical protein Airi02_039170 [Actinoallomurus iriomotensis]
MWQAVVAELRVYRRDGLAGLLTEDTLRFTAARALVEAGADPARLSVEWPHPVLRGSRVDLAVGGRPPAALVEFKFPREPNEKNAAWTMVLGEVLKDFYRLAICPGSVDRLFVYLESIRLRRYMTGATQRYGLDLNADQIVLHPTEVVSLPATAARIIGADLAAHHVTAQRVMQADIDDDLRLSVYMVDPLSPTPASATTPPTTASAVPGRPRDVGHDVEQEREPEPSQEDMDTSTVASLTPVAVGTREGARREILAAIRELLDRSVGETFTPEQVVAEMRRRGTGYAESTIRTMVTAHMCSNAPDNAGTTYDDLERIGRGIYRIRP